MNLEFVGLAQFSEQVIYCRSFRIALLSFVLLLRKSNDNQDFWSSDQADDSYQRTSNTSFLYPICG